MYIYYSKGIPINYLDHSVLFSAFMESHDHFSRQHSSTSTLENSRKTFSTKILPEQMTWPDQQTFGDIWAESFWFGASEFSKKKGPNNSVGKTTTTTTTTTTPTTTPAATTTTTTTTREQRPSMAAHVCKFLLEMINCSWNWRPL